MLAAQRRQLTVMFCDLAGSTELSAELDPEDMHEVIGAYHRVCTEAIERADGFVAKYLGDGVLAYFGYPQAHEDDAERAIHAALALEQAGSALGAPNGAPLAVRVGIATGLVVVGDLIGVGAAQERSVVGETPNLAARLQAMAPPGGVVVSNATRRLASGLFEFRDLGVPALKGLTLREPVWQVLGAKAAVDRFAARHERGPAPLVGRDAELQRVLEAWRQAAAGEGQVVGLVGEPGIGKSRLIYEVRREIRHEPHVRLEGGGAQLFRNTPFHAIAEMIRRRLAGHRALSPEGYRTALERSLSQAAVKAEHALPLIAELIGVPSPAEAAPLTLPADQRRSALLAALSEWLLNTAERWPTLMVVENLQWVDPSTLELLEQLIGRASGVRLLVLYSTRQATAAPWPLGPGHLRLELGRLDAESLERLMAFAGGEALPQDLVANVVARADGVPLFAEELARLLVDRPERAQAREVPGTLSDLLMARLDQLGSAKEVAQIAAVLGAEFQPRLLRLVSSWAEPPLAEALQTLIASDLLVARGSGDDQTYAFRHALIQDAAYEALLKSQRRALHRQAATVLAEDFPEITLAQPEILAQHWTRAGEPELAVSAWHEAGRHASGRWAYKEAEHAFTAALEVLASLPDSDQRDERELDLVSSLAQLLQFTLGYSAPGTIAATARARTLAEKGGDLEQRIMQMGGAWSAASSAGDYEAAGKLADQLLQLARLNGAPRAMGAACMFQMTSRYRTGDLIGAEAAFTTGRPYFASPEYRRLPGATPQTFGNAALLAWMMGEPEEGRRRIDRGLALSRESNNPFELAFAHHMAAQQAVLTANPHDAQAEGEESMRISEEHGFSQFAATSRVFLGRAAAELGRPDEGVALIQEGLQGIGGAPSRAGRTMYLTWLAEVQALAGRLDDALDTLEEALTANPRELFFRPESLRLRAACRLEKGDLEGAEADCRAAVSLSWTMGAKLFHERASAELVKLSDHRVTFVTADAPAIGSKTESGSAR
jgi:class 3 adenylate cyclase/tetratricopeptide (TPR) repeat protein